jgi:hypothetical protein
MAAGSRLDKIDREVLTPVVQKALENPSVRITEWDYHVVKGDWTSSKRLVCRFFGQGKLQEEEIPWSIFLKIANPPQTAFDIWRREPVQREALIYESGVLDDLPGGISAPRCLGVMEHSNDEPWIWLEDVSGEPAIEWLPERFKIAAYHFGILQGVFLAGAPLPDYPWMDISRWLKPRLARSAERIPIILEKFQTHPLTRELYDSEVGKRLRWLWANRETFFEAMVQMPKTLCHGDFCYANLIARRLPDGEDETVAIDWQYSGLGQIGGDIAGLIADCSLVPPRPKFERLYSQIVNKKDVKFWEADQEEFTETVLEQYMAGVREAAWKGNLDIVRFACLARLAFPWSFNLAGGLDGSIFSSPLTEDNRHDMEQKLDEYIRAQGILFNLAQEASALLEIVKRFSR